MKIRNIFSACIMAMATHASAIILEGELQLAPKDNPGGYDYYLLRTGTDEIIAGLMDSQGGLAGLEGMVNRIYGNTTGSFGESIPVVNVQRCGVGRFALPSGAQVQGGPALYTAENKVLLPKQGEAVLDHDGDGIPTAYELLNNLDPTRDDSQEDADGDGILNGDEEKAGSDPQSSDSGFRIVGFTPERNGFRVTWQSTELTPYRVVERSHKNGKELGQTTVYGGQTGLIQPKGTSSVLVVPTPPEKGEIDARIIAIELPF